MKQPLRLKHLSAAGIAGAAWFAVGTQFYFNVQSALSGNGAVLANLGNFFSFFTIETHIMLALVLTFSFAKRAHPFFVSEAVKAALVVYIIIVGTVYSYLLSHLYQPQGLQVVTNALLHEAIPILYPMYWLFFIEKGNLRWIDPVRWLLFPLSFFIYTLLRGAALGVYPYPFIDAAKIGYPAVFTNAMLLAAAFLGLGILVTLLDHTIAGKFSIRRSRLGRTVEL